MPTFSADEERAALEPWSITIDGRTHVARVVSRPQALAFWGVVERAKRGEVTPVEEEQALATLLRIAFPWRVSYRWRGDPVAQILALDPRIRTRALESFFASLTAELPSRPSGTNGKSDGSPSSAVPSA